MERYSIGIIGGADGPTAVFVSGSPLPMILVAAAVLLAAFLLVQYFRKRK